MSDCVLGVRCLYFHVWVPVRGCMVLRVRKVCLWFCGGNVSARVFVCVRVRVMCGPEECIWVCVQYMSIFVRTKIMWAFVRAWRMYLWGHLWTYSMCVCFRAFSVCMCVFVWIWMDLWGHEVYVCICRCVWGDRLCLWGYEECTGRDFSVHSLLIL